MRVGDWPEIERYAKNAPCASQARNCFQEGGSQECSPSTLVTGKLGIKQAGRPIELECRRVWCLQQASFWRAKR